MQIKFGPNHGCHRVHKALGALALGLVLVVSLLSSLPGAAAAADGQLIVFVQPQTELGSRFEQVHQPALKSLADELGLSWSVVNAAEGAPEEVAITPLLVFQNHRGRSIFQGRFTDLGRVENFVRTSRFAPQEDVDFTREETPLWKTGRTQLAAPIKISDVTGSPLADYNADSFREAAMTQIDSGFESLELSPSISLGRSDRLFYMDFYPWVSGSGELYLSLALFSQFHCKDPIFHTNDEPLVGPWAERDRLFREGAARLESEMKSQLTRDELGDGFDAVSTATPVVTWESLGLDLPAAPEGADIDVEGLAIARDWSLAPNEDDLPPSIQFRFPPPIDHYRGTVAQTSGRFSLGESFDVVDATGWVEAEVASASMGEQDLDDTIHGSIYLHATKFPSARFDLHSMQSDGGAIAFGNLTQVTVDGVFRLRGSELPLQFTAQLEPVVTEDREVRLLLDGEFAINLLEPFGMLAADGPSPQNETVIIDLALRFAPEPQSGIGPEESTDS